MVLKFSNVSLALAASLFVTQATLIYLWMYKYSLLFLIFLIGDGLLLLNFLLRRHENNSATAGGLQWFWYSLVLTLKTIFLVWYKPDELSMNISLKYLLPYPIFPTSVFPIILFITPAIYILLSFRAAPQLYGSPIYVLSTEGLLHSDLVTHVLLDLIDIVVQIQHEQYPTSVIVNSPWIYLYAGMILIIVLFFHGLSFPTSGGGEYTPFYHKGGDVYIVRKHAALVGIFLVDIPLLILRIYIWLTFPVIPGFNPWIMKNLLFIPLQIVRLNQCRLAEKERSKNSQRASFFDDLGISQENTQSNPPIIPATRGKPQLHIGRSKTMDLRNSSLELVTPGINMNFDNTSINTLKPDHSQQTMNLHSYQRSLSNILFRQKASKTTIEPLNNSLLINTQAPKDGSIPPEITREAKESFSQPDIRSKEINNEIMDIIKDVKINRKIPPYGFSIKVILKQIFYTFQRSGQSAYLACFLDNSLELSQFQNIRLSLAFIIPLISQIIIVILCRNTNSQGSQSQCYSTWFFPYLSNAKYSNTTPCSAGYIGIVLINAIGYIILWYGTCGVVEIIGGAFYQMVILNSFFSVVHTIRNSAYIDPYLSRNGIDVAYILVLLCMCPAALLLLFNYFPLSSAFLGRKFLRFASPIGKKQWLNNNAPSSNTPNQPTIGLNNKRISRGYTNEHCREDELGFISTGSVLLLLNCRYGLAPVSLNELLIGPDTIKGIRLTDILLGILYRDILFLLVTRGTMLCMCFTWFSLASFLAHILITLIYGITAHTIRLLSLRRYELKILFQQVLKEITYGENTQPYNQLVPNFPTNTLGTQGLRRNKVINEEWRNTLTSSNILQPQIIKESTKDNFPIIQSIAQISQPFISASDIIKKYWESGFFSSPGNIVLPSALGSIPL
ncbi:hypothetical protein cand_035040 [Cryptosporidium andersoni]|uniref:Transmembrane protein n=1 Tax=Cryptosporidium andersoni TaxID=117008 RepID=A0A1J4MW11_9CRYT|nr:hypothetical protein cand_035040 [Cryptosporidium andersoni]